ncbi:hypothetical protein [Luteitalea sp.]
MSDSGYRLAIADSAPPWLHDELDARVRLYMHDVRAMLMLPAPACGITSSCNFAAAAVLLNVLSGLSRLLMDGPSKSHDAFLGFVERWYPWECEPHGNWVEAKSRAEVLYESFRNGLAHDLMSGLVQDARYGWVLRQPGMLRGIKKSSVPPGGLEELDDAVVRPVWLGATLANIDTYEADAKVNQRDVIALDVHALYWGVRRTVWAWSGDVDAVAHLADLLQRPRRPS